LISRPDNFVEVFWEGDGIAARRWPFLYISRDRKEAVANSSGGHSNVTEVWVTLRSYVCRISAVFHGKIDAPTLICGAFGIP
jgi:hypothetical protein